MIWLCMLCLHWLRPCAQWIVSSCLSSHPTLSLYVDYSAPCTADRIYCSSDLLPFSKLFICYTCAQAPKWNIFHASTSHCSNLLFVDFPFSYCRYHQTLQLEGHSFVLYEHAVCLYWPFMIICAREEGRISFKLVPIYQAEIAYVWMCVHHTYWRIIFFCVHHFLFQCLHFHDTIYVLNLSLSFMNLFDIFQSGHTQTVMLVCVFFTGMRPETVMQINVCHAESGSVWVR